MKYSNLNYFEKQAETLHHFELKYMYLKTNNLIIWQRNLQTN